MNGILIVMFQVIPFKGLAPGTLQSKVVKGIVSHIVNEVTQTKAEKNTCKGAFPKEIKMRRIATGRLTTGGITSRQESLG
jgi:hypothetical protein